MTLTPGFETKAQVRADDIDRAKRLRLQAGKVTGSQRRALVTLANSIDPQVTPHPTTPASSRYMRLQRIQSLGWVWHHIYEADQGRAVENGYAPTVTFTAVPQGSSVPLGMLHNIDGAKRMATFRQHLNRVMANMGERPDGFLSAYLHGAYDPTTQSYPLHYHGTATGGMIAVVDGLRELAVYRPAKPGDGRDAANTPIVMSRGLLTNMPDPLSYCMKRFWSLRETYLASSGVRKSYGGAVRRIPEPAHSEYLHFLHRHRLEDLTLLVGLHATREGLKRTR